MIKKSLPFFTSDFERDFYPKTVYFEFHGLPLLTVKTDRQDLRGLDLGKSDVIYSIA